MKKILFVVLFFASLAVTAQRPFKITNSVLKLIWGGDSVVCTLTGDSVYFTTSQGQYVFDKSVILGDDLTIGTYLLSTSDTVAVIENGTVKYRLIGTISVAYADSAAVSYFSDTSENCYICDSALNANRWQTWDTAYVIGIIADSNFWKLTGNKLEPKVSTNYINTDSSYYIKGDEVLLHSVDLNTFGAGVQVLGLNTGQYIGAAGNSLLYENSGSYIGAGGWDVLNNNKGSAVSAFGISLADSNNLSYWCFLGSGKDSTDTWINGYTGTGTKRIHLNGTTYIKNVPAATNDTVLFWENGIVKYKILDMTPYLKFSDTTSTLLTQSKASNTYQLKYWSRTGTTLTPVTSTDTVVLKYQRISSMHPTGTTLLEVTSTGLLDTIASTPMSLIYVEKSGDALNGDFHLVGGTISLDTYAATEQKSLITQPSGLIDTVPMVTIDDAVISSITLTDSISIGGIVTISDTILVADEDSIYFKRGKSGWGSIYADSLGTMVTWSNFYWDSNGTPHLQNNGDRVVASDTDTNVICLYSYGGGLVIRNRSGSTMKFKTILNY